VGEGKIERERERVRGRGRGICVCVCDLFSLERVTCCVSTVGQFSLSHKQDEAKTL